MASTHAIQLIFVISWCFCGIKCQVPVLSVTNFAQSEDCLLNGQGRVTMHGTVDMTGVNTAVWPLKVGFVNSTMPLCRVDIATNGCGVNPSAPCYCESKTGDIYKVVLNMTAESRFNNQNVGLSMQNTDFVTKSYSSDNYTQPYVSGNITLTLNGGVVDVTNCILPDGNNFTFCAKGMSVPNTIDVQVTAANGVHSIHVSNEQCTPPMEFPDVESLNITYREADHCKRTGTFICRKPDDIDCLHNPQCYIPIIIGCVILIAVLLCAIAYLLIDRISMSHKDKHEDLLAKLDQKHKCRKGGQSNPTDCIGTKWKKTLYVFVLPEDPLKIEKVDLKRGKEKDSATTVVSLDSSNKQTVEELLKKMALTKPVCYNGKMLDNSLDLASLCERSVWIYYTWRTCFFIMGTTIKGDDKNKDHAGIKDPESGGTKNQYTNVKHQAPRDTTDFKLEKQVAI